MVQMAQRLNQKMKWESATPKASATAILHQNVHCCVFVLCNKMHPLVKTSTGNVTDTDNYIYM